GGCGARRAPRRGRAVGDDGRGRGDAAGRDRESAAHRGSSDLAHPSWRWRRARVVLRARSGSCASRRARAHHRRGRASRSGARGGDRVPCRARARLKRYMGLAHWLTVLRILLIPVFVSLLVYRKPGLALLVFGVAALTDLLDGYVARRHGLQSRLGAFLDPMADKLLLVSSFVTLTWLKTLPFWIAAVVISRDIILMVGALMIHMAGGHIYPRPTRMGKAATFFQVLTVLTGLASRFVSV